MFLHKIAHIKPLIEKQGLDKELLKNYRPASNILKKVVLKQLKECLVSNELIDVLQSVYRAKQSTETAVKVQSDILSSLYCCPGLA